MVSAMHRRLICVCVCLYASVGVAAPAERSVVESAVAANRAAAQINEVFAALDADESQSIELEEFIQRELDADVLRRDFKLYDFNFDGVLSKAEFGSADGITPPAYRSEIPDPWNDVLENAVMALDEAYGGWNQRGNESVNIRLFISDFYHSVDAGARFAPTGNLLGRIDGNGDGAVTRTEARRFLETQLGIRRSDGYRLREPTGRLVRLSQWTQFDADQSGAISRDEFQRRWWDKETLQETFDAQDLNRDDEIEFEEFIDRNTENFQDPVLWFREADTNLDALLDAAEIAASSPGYKKVLLSSTVPAFDIDGDQKLTLDEYMLSMHSCSNHYWSRHCIDRNGDDKLSFEEFEFVTDGKLALQRRFFFYCLDRDQTGWLSPDEYQFKLQMPKIVHLLDVDRGDLQPIYQGAVLKSCGSPSFGQDGESFLIDASRPGSTSSSTVLLVSVSGEVLEDFGPGMLPSYAPDGKRFADCWFQDGAFSIRLTDIETRTTKVVATGRSPEWSPDGKFIVYTNDAELWLYDFGTGTTRQLLSSDDHGGQTIHQNMAWDTTSNRLAIKTTVGGLGALQIVNDVTGHPTVTKRFESRQVFGWDLAWSADGTQVLTTLKQPTDKLQGIYAFDVDGDAPPARLKSFGEKHSWTSFAVSSDRKRMVGVAAP